MININGKSWRVRLVSPTHPNLIRSNGSKALGCCDDIDKTIYISKELDRFYLKKVLTHEITHAAMFSYNVHLTYEEEELMADLIATYGHEIINLTNSIFKQIKKGDL